MMFKKSRYKIVAAIMAILALLWIGTLCVIYGSSYYEVSTRNKEMLDRHTELYMLHQQPTDKVPHNKPDSDRGGPPFENTPAFQLTTFYSVAFSEDGSVLEIKNMQEKVYTDQDLEDIARKVLSEGKSTGVENSLVYRVADKGSYTLVAFMDNTIIRQSMSTMFRYTLMFGCLALIPLFFLAMYLSRKIVQPLEESYQKQKQFISDAGHELKTPISVVNANAELLSRQLGENQWLSNIQYENRRMGVLVTQLLELAQTENVIPSMKSVDFSRLVAGEALPFETIAFEKGLTLHCQAADHLHVRGNSSQLRQLTAILVDNAIAHAKGGKDIILLLREERNYAVLSVINNGEEIPPHQRKQLFERFYRMDCARNSEDKHYGLGLAIAKAIAETHGGKIAISCYDGKVECTVHIPLEK